MVLPSQQECTRTRPVKSKPCSSPTGKNAEGPIVQEQERCKRETPRFYRRIQSLIHPNNGRNLQRQKTDNNPVAKKNWKLQPKTAICKPCNRRTKFSQWYGRRKALRELSKLTDLEKKQQKYLQLEKTRCLREAKFLEHLKQREREIHEIEHRLKILPKTKFSAYPRKQRYAEQKPFMSKRKKNKRKSTKAKPSFQSRYVFTKPQKRHPKDSFNDRCVSYCYRICCQFYCCAAFILIIGLLFIFVY